MQARHIYICDYHKDVIQKARTKRRRKDSEDDSNETDTDLPEVDLFQLQVNTLRRYKRHYKVSTRPGTNKAQLADASITKAQLCSGNCHFGHLFAIHLQLFAVLILQYNIIISKFISLCKILSRLCSTLLLQFTSNIVHIVLYHISII